MINSTPFRFVDKRTCVSIYVSLCCVITEEMAKKWIETFKDTKAIAEALDALKSFTCSPFLYGEHIDMAHWTTKV